MTTEGDIIPIIGRYDESRAIKSLPAHTLAYMAGIVDGEGCITALLRGSSTRCKHKQVNPVLVVVNTDPKLVEWLQRYYCGSVTTRTPAADKNWKRQYRWTASHATLEAILTALLPYLILKRRQAQLVLHLLATANGRGVTYDPGKRMDREATLSLLHSLNARGRSTHPRGNHERTPDRHLSSPALPD